MRVRTFGAHHNVGSVHYDSGRTGRLGPLEAWSRLPSRTRAAAGTVILFIVNEHVYQYLLEPRGGGYTFH